MVIQTASLVRRNKENVSQSAASAGIKLMQTFSLEQAAASKREVPFAVWRVIKRLLNDVNGHDVFGSEKKLRKYLYEKCNLKYETGTFHSLSGKMVTFVRITDAAEVLQKMIGNFTGKW